jgi:hypothetical protein
MWGEWHKVQGKGLVGIVEVLEVVRKAVVGVYLLQVVANAKLGVVQVGVLARVGVVYVGLWRGGLRDIQLPPFVLDASEGEELLPRKVSGDLVFSASF